MPQRLSIFTLTLGLMVLGGYGASVEPEMVAPENISVCVTITVIEAASLPFLAGP